MNSLKIIIAPIVFLSIVTCFAQIKNIGDLGRIGAKIMGVYLLTTVIALVIGIGLFLVFEPGNRAFALSGNVAAAGTIQLPQFFYSHHMHSASIHHPVTICAKARQIRCGIDRHLFIQR